MSDDLLKRLRTSWDADRSIISQTEKWMKERKEAADRIAELEGQLKATLDREAESQKRHDLKMDRLEAEVLALRQKLEQYKSAITYAAIVVDQVANDEDVDPNALMAALLEIEVVAPKKLEDKTDE